MRRPARGAVAAALVAVLALVALAAGLYLLGRDHGDTAGAARVQAKWDKQTRKEELAREQASKESHTQSELYARKAAELELTYERTNAALQRALRRPITCPASGAVGDVVLPADLVDSMFNRPGDSEAGPAER